MISKDAAVLVYDFFLIKFHISGILFIEDALMLGDA